MPEDVQLNLEKFGSIGGDYFEHLVALALDELGYVEGKTYLASWAKKCVPGTWIEADFIISKQSDRSGDPLTRGRVVLAIGHATSEDSARMKFHRDVEQLLEVKALTNGDEYRVMDILFCCPRETMGGWSKELVAINEAIFDNSLIVWKRDWGLRLLQQIQLHGEKLTQGDNAAKKRKLKSLLTKFPAFQRQFNELRDHLGTMLVDRKSHSRIGDIFIEERKQLPVRLSRPLLINRPETTDFKRGLLQVLALNPWEVELLHLNHEKNGIGKFYPLEKLALEQGMSQADFDAWWKRLQLLSVKLGSCSAEYLDDEVLDADAREWRVFKTSKELGYILERFSVEQITKVRTDVSSYAPNLSPYVKDLNDLTRYALWRKQLGEHIGDSIDAFHAFASTSPDKSVDYVRLAYVEVGMTIINIDDPSFSYDKLAKATPLPSLVRQSDHARFFAAGQRPKSDTKAKALTAALRDKLRKVPADHWSDPRGVERFIARRLDGMIKQHRGGALDLLIGRNVRDFARRIGADLLAGTNHSFFSALNIFAGTDECGVNVEIPYLLALPFGKKILVHRVNANDGHAADKRKEFSSKIRSIRYHWHGQKCEMRADIAATVLVLDGKWIPETNADPLSHIRMLTVAGWDYVVYPDQLAHAFALIEKSLKSETGKTAIPMDLSDNGDLAMAAEEDVPQKLTKRRKSNGR